MWLVNSMQWSSLATHNKFYLVLHIFFPTNRIHGKYVCYNDSSKVTSITTINLAHQLAVVFIESICRRGNTITVLVHYSPGVTGILWPWCLIIIGYLTLVCYRLCRLRFGTSESLTFINYQHIWILPSMWHHMCECTNFKFHRLPLNFDMQFKVDPRYDVWLCTYTHGRSKLGFLNN